MTLQNQTETKLLWNRPKTLVSKLGSIEITPMEERKRQMRAMRFQTDIPVTRTPIPPPATKKKNKSTPITWEGGPAVDINAEIVGTSVELEKPYFRLTSVCLILKTC